MSTFAGIGTGGFSGDNGPATAAKIKNPTGVSVSAAGDLFIADFGNQRVRKVDTTGTISTYAGVGTAGSTGDGGSAVLAELGGPTDVAMASTGILYIADANNHKIRAVAPGGTIDTFAGTGNAGYLGDGGPATSARLRHPTGVALALDGSLIIADELNDVVRQVASKCGDAVLDAGEVCDLGSANGTQGVCCDFDCSLRGSGEVCRDATDLCDHAETCNGSSTTCPADTAAPVGTLCRGAGDVCDVAETCDGTSKACPVDGFVGAGTECRGPAGPCDAAETCTGSGAACPADVKRASGEVCHASAGNCDPAETCDGASDTCPADVVASAGTECRGSGGQCDVAESCDGVSVACPADIKVAAGTECRGSTGVCDPAEACTGSTNTCPADIFSDDADVDNTCDYQDNCVGLANAGQEDTDADGVGDACDNCLTTCNPDQTDTDADTAGGDACDACPAYEPGRSRTRTCGRGSRVGAGLLPGGRLGGAAGRSGRRCVLARHPAQLVPPTAAIALAFRPVLRRARRRAVTALTRGVLGVDPDAVQVAASAHFTPDAMSFARRSRSACAGRMATTMVSRTARA